MVSSGSDNLSRNVLLWRDLRNDQVPLDMGQWQHLSVASCKQSMAWILRMCGGMFCTELAGWLMSDTVTYVDSLIKEHWCRVYKVAARADLHIVWFCEVTEISSHAESIGKLNVSHTPEMLLEEGTQTEVVNPPPTPTWLHTVLGRTPLDKGYLQTDKTGVKCGHTEVQGSH
jgi:hypothetical protein